MPAFIGLWFARYRTPIIVISGLLAMVLAVGLIAHWYVGNEREEAVTLDRRDASLEAANRTLEANERATADQAASTATATNLQIEVQHEATTKSDNSSVGPGTTAVLRRVREQQAAGRR